MLQRMFDWFSGLNVVQKVLAVLFAALLLFALSNLLSTAVFVLMGGGGERSNTPSERDGAAPGGTSPETNQEADADLEITSARWEGAKAVVEGTWEGEFSSVHCDLLEGRNGGSATDWWDRGVPARMSWSEQTFTQEFVEVRGRDIEDPIDPTASYSVVCWAQFSGGWATSAKAPVEGTPPG